MEISLRFFHSNKSKVQTRLESIMSSERSIELTFLRVESFGVKNFRIESFRVESFGVESFMS